MFDTKAELLDVYRATPVTLRALVAQADNALLKRRPAANDWAVIEIVAHLADTEERAMKRVERMLHEDNPALPGYDPAELADVRDYRSMDLANELDLFASVRATQIALLEGIDDAAWGRTGQHEETGEITVEALTAHMAAHDAIHLAQIARILGDR